MKTEYYRDYSSRNMLLKKNMVACNYRIDKNALRRQAYNTRAAQLDRQIISHRICQSFLAHPDFKQAETIMLYLDCRTEVRTQETVTALLRSAKRIVIPYCTVDDAGVNVLGLWLLESMDELVSGTWNILEPPRERWGEAGKEIDPQNLDFIMVPGVAFDKNGGRLGNGGGYYDRLLHNVRNDTTLIGACFECQLVEKIPMEAHDVFLDGIITELCVYNSPGRNP